MKLKDLLLMFGVKNIELKQYKADGSFMATIVGEDKSTIQLFTTKKTNIDTVSGDSPINIIDSKYYIGEFKAPIATHTVAI